MVDLIESLGEGNNQPVGTRYIPCSPAYLNLTLYESAQHPSTSSTFQALIDHYRLSIVHIHYWADCGQDWREHIFHACEVKGVPVIQNINTPIAPFASPVIHQKIYVSDYVRQTFGEHDAQGMGIHPESNLDHFPPSDFAIRANDCIGMVYRLETGKLNSSSIDVFIRVAQLRPTSRCLIVGDGSLKPIIEQMVAKAGVTDNFVFTGYVPYQDLPAFYRQMKSCQVFNQSMCRACLWLHDHDHGWKTDKKDWARKERGLVGPQEPDLQLPSFSQALCPRSNGCMSHS